MRSSGNKSLVYFNVPNPPPNDGGLRWNSLKINDDGVILGRISGSSGSKLWEPTLGKYVLLDVNAFRLTDSLAGDFSKSNYLLSSHALVVRSWVDADGKPSNVPLYSTIPSEKLFPEDTPYYNISLKDISNSGLILSKARKVGSSENKALILLPIELNSKDRLVQGAFEIPEGWQDFSLSFRNTTSGEDLGTYENLEPGATTDVKVYDDSADFFSDDEMAQASSGNLPENVRDQKVVFARDPENPRRLRFCTVFDNLGEVEVKLTFGPNQTEGVAGITLTRDDQMAGFISSVNDRVLSIEVPGGEDIPIDVDGDGIPDGGGGGGGGDDILQALNAGTMANPGAPVPDAGEGNPANFVVAINDDDDGDPGSGQPDNGDTVIAAADNDIATLILKIPTGVPADIGTMNLTVTGGGVRVFNSGGTAVLNDYSVNLASPVGNLAALAVDRQVRLFVEGLAASPDVAFTLTYSDGQGQVQHADSVHMMVVPRDQLAWLNPVDAIRTAYGDPMAATMRTYADNGAPVLTPISLVPIGEEPTVRNRGMLAKVFFDIPLGAVKSQISWTKGFFDGFWIALKGDFESAGELAEFFTYDPYGRSAAAWAAVQEAIAALREIPPDELLQTLEEMPVNLTRELYTAAENNLPWEPVTDGLSPDVLYYMGGFTVGTLTESVAISLTGAGLVGKVGSVVKGIVASSKTGYYSLTVLNALRKATNKTTHTLMRLGTTPKEVASIGAIGKYLERVELSGGKKASERFAEAFHDKPDLTTRFLENYRDHWKDLPEARRVVRYKLAAHRVAELKDIMGDTLTDDALEGFGILQKKLFKIDKDDTDRFNDLVALWKGLDTPAKKQSLNDSLAAYKQAVQSDPDAKFWVKNITSFETVGHRYVSQGGLDLLQSNGNKFPVNTNKGWFSSSDSYASATEAIDKLQLPNPVVARVDFSLFSVQNNVRVAFNANDDNPRLFEFLARAFPGYGSGGGTQFLVDGAEIPITGVNILQ